jgi:LuxR family transcriptional regulator, maltose regulon positive regulatory protein
MQAVAELSFARTKIQPPRLRADLISRPTLDADLQQALAEQRLTLVLAPAGWGKTSALARQLAQLPKSTALAWVSADADDDVPRFLAGLTAALEPLDLPWRVSPSALGNLLQSERGLRLVADEIINALSESEAQRGLLVLDDVHRWSDPKLFELLATIVERLPGAWGLVVASRTEPAMPLARLRARGELTEFRQSALRFDTNEVKALLQAQGLSPDQAEELHQRTQGWAAGLRLMLSVGKSAAQSSSRSQRNVFDYLADEVLAGMAPDLRLFLLRCSVLPELTVERCAHVSGLPNAAALFEHIEREGLFVSPLDDVGRTLRLHDLFRDFLEERLQREHGDEVALLLQRAADHEPDLLRTVTWLTRAGAHDRAATELATRGPALIHMGGRPAIERMLKLFALPRVAANPALSFLRGQCAYQAFDFDELVAAMQVATRGFEAQGQHELASIARVLLNAGRQNSGQLAQAREDLAHMAALRVGGAGGAMLAFDTAMQAYADARQDQVAPALANMLEHLETVPQHPIWADLILMTVFLMLPDVLPHLERFYRSAARGVTNEASVLRVSLMHGRAIQAFAAGRLDDAHTWLTSADDDMQWLGKPISLRTENFMLHMLINAVRGEEEACRQAIRSALEDLAASALSNQRAHGSNVRVTAARALFFLDDAQGLRLLQQQMHQGRSAGEWAIAGAEQQLVDGMIALIRGELEAAEKLLSPGQNPIFWTTYGTGANALVLCAEAQRRLGKWDAAAASLTHLLRESVASKRFGAALLAGPAILKNLANAAWGKRLSDADQAELRRWAAIASGDAAPDGALAEANALPAGLSEREAEVLTLVTKGQSNKLIARELSLSLFTVKRHVANILNKTGLSSRTELATWWLGQGRSR